MNVDEEGGAVNLFSWLIFFCFMWEERSNLKAQRLTFFLLVQEFKKEIRD
jgi:hypothetical protein